MPIRLDSDGELEAVGKFNVSLARVMRSLAERHGRSEQTVHAADRIARRHLLALERRSERRLQIVPLAVDRNGATGSSQPERADGQRLGMVRSETQTDRSGKYPLEQARNR